MPASRVRRTRIPRSGLLLLAAALLIYSGGDLWQNISWPAFYSFDETLEVDYVYQLTQGHLPTFFGGAEFNPLHLQYPYDVQWRYQHPPLFYLLEMPVFLLFDTLNHPIRGIWAMRALVWVMGVTLVCTSRWAARWMIGREGFAVSLVPVIVAANRCLPSVVFNYTLASLWVTLLIGMTAKLLRTLPFDVSTRRGTFAGWLVIVTLAPLTRLSTIPIMGLCLLIVFIAVLLGDEHKARGVLLLTIVPGVLAVLSSAWFYLRLHALSGNFTGSQPEWSSTHLQRDTHKSFVESLLNPGFYKSTMSQYQNSSVTGTPHGWAFVLALTIIPLMLGFLAMIRWIASAVRNRDRAGVTNTSLMVALLCCAFFGTVFQQLLFYKQGGSANAVYFSLISIVFAVTISLGLTQFERGNGVVAKLLAGCWLACKLATFLYETKLRWPFAAGGTMEQAGSMMRSAAWLAIAVTVVGVLLAAVTTCLSSAAPARPEAR
ncbi:hypothetical protein [Bifidobacterium biavatii]|uniref:hypothetical protein n=1 Tax=Bifidobacterium biavatii TaxID=762212 RepID=UPI000ACD16DC|nr:hypothetical protein [Bifidobacterium biavatii]